MKCPRCQQENPLQAKFCLDCGAPAGRAATAGASYVELQDENERLRRSQAESAEQQAASAEILRLISRSPTVIQPVFEALLQWAVRLCAAEHAALFRFDGSQIHLVAAHGFPPDDLASISREYPMAPTRSKLSGRAIFSREVAQVGDIFADPDYRPTQQALVSGFRSILAVPMLRSGEPVGAILIYRSEVGLFPDKQVTLLQAFADQAVIAIENVRLFNELQARNRDLTATSEILRVIASSPTNVQPVFDTIADNAMKLFRPWSVAVYRFDGKFMHVMAVRGGLPGSEQYLRERSGRQPTRDVMAGRCVIDRSVIHVPDFETDPGVPLAAREIARARGFRATISVPMLRDGEPIGVISVSRTESGPFSRSEIDLLRTFADQAVIAIENVRLFKELEARNRDLTATGEILRVISSSPTDVQPVFRTIAQSAARLCEAFDAAVFERDGDWLRLVAHHGLLSDRADLSIPVIRGTVTGRCVLDRQTVSVADLQAAGDDFPQGVAFAREFGFRSFVSVPLLRDGIAVGAIGIRRTEVQPFTEQQIALLQTFADQAVIAIENVRLFTELQTRNRDLTEALDRQTATAEILRVISESQSDVQPVFDAIVDNAMRLFRAWAAAIVQLDGQLLHLIAVRGGRPGLDQYLREQSPWSIHWPTPAARSIAERTVIHIPDTEADRSADEEIREIRRRGGMRSVLAVPMLRDGQPIGAMWISRTEAGSFSPAEISLLQTFADQAVIAIENTRLLVELRARTQELSRSVGELQALGEVSQAVSSTLDLQTVLSTIVARATQLAGADAGVIYEYDEQREVFEPRATDRVEGEIMQALAAAPIRKGQGVTGRLAEVLEPMQLPDIRVQGRQLPIRDVMIRAGYRALLAVPLAREGFLIGGLTVFRRTPGEFVSDVVELLKTFATQSALAIQNARLFREIEIKSRQLEIASQHKSEFLANMSHELRTPLNAVIGFSEVLSERMFGEVNEKQDEYLRDIHASGQHLLSLINDILDLSKIEAGRMELELSEFNLPATLDNALTLVRERAGRRSIALDLMVDQRLEQIQADERKVRQVVLNLLSNAIKFTPEGGRIEVRAVPVEGSVEVSVTDTGVGIAPEDQEAIFEEFKQVGTAAKKVEGTGLGLALSRKFIELHGGRIWVKSQIGVGSTFTFTIPLSR